MAGFALATVLNLVAGVSSLHQAASLLLAGIRTNTAEACLLSASIGAWANRQAGAAPGSEDWALVTGKR
jgi:hypothetical protein